MVSNYSKLTPKCDLGKKQPKKDLVRKHIAKLKKYDYAVRKRMNPDFATTYPPEFTHSFRKICSIYAKSRFQKPQIQVLILMLDNQIHPCRADEFNESIALRLGKGIF